MFDDDDAALDADSGSDDGQSEGFIQAVEDAWEAAWSFLPTGIALSDPVSAFTMGDGNEPEDGFVTKPFSDTLLGSALTTGKDDALSAVGIDPNIPLWAYLAALVVILLLVAYITREVAG